MQTYIYIYISFHILFHYDLSQELNTVPCATQQDLVIRSIYNSVHQLTPHSQSSRPRPSSLLATTRLFSRSVSLFLLHREVHLYEQTHVLMPILQRSTLKGRETEFCVLAHTAVKEQRWNLNTKLAQVCAFNRFAVILSIPRVRQFAGMNAFSSVTQSRPTLCDPVNRSTPGLPVHHQLPEFTQTHAHRVGDAIQPSHPLSSPSPAPNPSQHQGLFQ